MKRILTITVAAIAIASLALISCEDKPKNQPWDPNAMISLRPAAGVKAETNPGHLTPIEIVKQTDNMWWYAKSIQEAPVNRGFADVQRDTIAPRLLMWGSDVITAEGELLETFIGGEDIVLIRGLADPVRLDTIAYISNSVLRNAESIIRPAFAVQDYATCYDAFDKAFRFLPITGEEWRELKAQGLN